MLSKVDSEQTPVKICAECSEIMPLCEKICYCGGPVKIVYVTKLKAADAKDYYRRRGMYYIRGKT